MGFHAGLSRFFTQKDPKETSLPGTAESLLESKAFAGVCELCDHGSKPLQCTRDQSRGSLGSSGVLFWSLFAKEEICLSMQY